MDDASGRRLWIEDNPGDAPSIEEMRSDAGGRLFHLVRVERLSAGLERLAAGDIAAVLLDPGLPDCFYVFFIAPARPPIVLWAHG